MRDGWRIDGGMNGWIDGWIGRCLNKWESEKIKGGLRRRE